MTNTIKTIRKIEQDFKESNPPFDTVEFPEERLLEEVKLNIGNGEPAAIGMEETLKILSAFAMLDYNRDANQLTDNLIELQEKRPNWFDAYCVPHSEENVENVFENVGFRYPSRDAHGWCRNNEILRDKYHGEWSEFVLSTSCDAQTLVRQLEKDGFLYLKGVKIAPMYARFIDEYVCDLRNLWKLDIPVDTWIRKISREFMGVEADDDEIRNWWENVGPMADVDRHVVDGALWLIGNNLDEWGEDYLKEVADIEEFEYL